MVPVGRRSSGYRSYRGSRGRRVSTSAAGHQRVRQGDVILTTVDTAAAWRVEKPITLAAIAAFVAFGLAGCGTSNNLLGSTETPTKVATPGAPPAATPQAKVAIAPVIGAPDAIAKQLQSQLGTALDQKGIGTVKTTDKAESRAARLHRVRARESRHQGLLHLGRDRSRRQARQPHHGRGTRRRGAGQGPVGVGQRAAHPEHRRQDRRVARDLAAEPQERGGGEQRCHRHRLGRSAGRAKHDRGRQHRSGGRERPLPPLRPTRRRGASAATPA